MRSAASYLWDFVLDVLVAIVAAVAERLLERKKEDEHD